MWNILAYLRTGVQCPLIEHDNSGARIVMLVNVLNVYRFKKATKKATGYISPYMDYLLHAAYVSLNIMGNLQLINRNLPPILIFVLEI